MTNCLDHLNLTPKVPLFHKYKKVKFPHMDFKKNMRISHEENES